MKIIKYVIDIGSDLIFIKWLHGNLQVGYYVWQAIDKRRVGAIGWYQ
jgi:hypothetical protein